jgi:type IX secretion system substrate protein/SdrD B-like protein
MKMKKLFTTNVILMLLSSLFCLHGYAQNTVSGVVSYHHNQTVLIEDVAVSLVDVAGSVFATDTTDANGVYNFLNVPTGQYSLQSSTNIEAGGIDLSDSFLIFMHLLGWYNLNGIQFLAADVDADGQITWDDYWDIVIGWLLQGNPFSAGEWVFDEPIFTVGGGNRDSISVVGSGVGDVDGGWSPGTKSLPFVGTSSFGITAIKGGTVEVPISINTQNELGGFCFDIAYPSGNLKILGVKSELPNLNYQIFKDNVRISWTDMNQSNMILTNQVVVKIVAEVKENADASEIAFAINPGSHVINSKGELLDNVNVAMPNIHLVAETLQIGALYPNPGTGILNVDLSNPVEGNLKLQLFDVQGRMLKNIDIASQVGFYTQMFDFSDLEAGHYIYRLQLSAENQRCIFTDHLVITK